VSIDLSASFRKIVQEYFPNAKIAADHFNVGRMVNDALDNVRKELQSGLRNSCCRYFKHSQKVLLKREKDLTEENRNILEVLLNHSEQLSAAYGMKEVDFKISESKDSAEFSKRLRQFTESTKKQAIKEFKMLLQTTNRWKEELICVIANGLNNGFTECNTTIKTLKWVCYRFRNSGNFSRHVLFVLNNEDWLLRRIRHFPLTIVHENRGRTTFSPSSHHNA
jgi:transposase